VLSCDSRSRAAQKLSAKLVGAFARYVGGDPELARETKSMMDFQAHFGRRILRAAATVGNGFACRGRALQLFQPAMSRNRPAHEP
jgi:hypothetical protein